MSKFDSIIVDRQGSQEEVLETRLQILLKNTLVQQTTERKISLLLRVEKNLFFKFTSVLAFAFGFAFSIGFALGSALAFAIGFGFEFRFVIMKGF